MRYLKSIFFFFCIYLINAKPIFAASTSSEITNYTNDTLSIITLVAAVSAVFFLIKGGYLYLTSVGKPESLEQAKKTIRNALIGLVIVIAAGLIVSVFQNALNSSGGSAGDASINISPVETIKPSDGLTQVLIDAVSGFLRNIVESATKPIVDGIFTYLTTTPSLLNNQVIFKFWLVMLGITDSLFVLIVALLGLHFMSASTLGFEEMELKQLFPRIGLAFLGANISLFLADYAILTSNALVKTVIDSTGGLNHAWIVNAINPSTLASGTTPLITLIFLVLFLIISIVLLLLYISRLIMISLFAVLSPFLFLLWTLPKFSDISEIAAKTYLTTVFIVFVHVVVIQLASSFLAFPEHSGNSLISILVAIGLFITLLKIPQLLIQISFYTSKGSAFKKFGGQIINVLTTSSSSSVPQTVGEVPVRTPRKVVKV